MTFAPPPLHQQAAAVERAAENLRGHCRNLYELAGKGKRSWAEYEMAKAWLPDLNAAAVTMRALAHRHEGAPP